MSKQKVRVESASVDIENGPHPQAEAPEGSAVSDRVQELQVVFRQLMHDYAAVLGQATALGRFKAGDIPTDSTTPSGELGGGNHGALFLPLLRLMAGAHVRKQLDAVAARFAQIRSTLDPETEAGDRSWLGHARDEAVEIASHLPSLRIPGVFVVIPFILGLGTGLGKVATGVDGAVWFVIGVVIFFLGFLAYRDTRDAFRVKRELFLPGAATVDRLPAEEQQDHEGINVHRDEQTFAIALGRFRSARGEHCGLGAWVRSSVRERDLRATSP